MLLHDTEIMRYCMDQRMVTPFQEHLLNPASLDVRLGNHILVESRKPGQRWEMWDISSNTKECPFDMAPGQFVLAETEELFAIPEDISCLFCLKSSRAREGYEHSHAGFAECGWYGSRLTLELKNNLQYSPLPLYPGLRIGQMLFFLMTGTPERDYATLGHYNMQPIVTPSWEQ